MSMIVLLVSILILILKFSEKKPVSLLTQAKFDLRDWKYTGKDPESQSTVLVWDTYMGHQKGYFNVTGISCTDDHGENNEESHFITSTESLRPSRIRLFRTVKTKITIARSVE